MNSFDSLILKLDNFIRKYYKNQLIKGGFYFGFLILSFFLTFALLEYFGNFNTIGRGFLFFSFLIVGLCLLVYYIISPLLKIYRLGSLITHEKAAEIIGLHFPDIQDKIINTLQLKSLKDQGSVSLLNASIQKRSDAFNKVAFNNAINLKENVKHIKPLFLVFLVFILLSFIDRSIIFSSADRIIHYSTKETNSLPFSVELVNSSLLVLEQEDCLVQFRVNGKRIPNELAINYDDKSFTLNKKNDTTFEYVFKTVTRKIPFSIVHNNEAISAFSLSVIPKPKINSFFVYLDYPSYTKTPSDTLKNIGNINAPEGSMIKWSFNTQNVDSVNAVFNDTNYLFNPQREGAFIKQLYRPQDYSIILWNNESEFKDTSLFYANIKKDLAPKISVQQSIDSTNLYLRYFNGETYDDYGFSSLFFCYLEISSNKYIKKSLPINKETSKHSFYHFFNLLDLGLKPGEQTTYYFEIWDNDEINGPKKSRSKPAVFVSPTLKQQSENSKEKNNQFKVELEKNISDALKLKNELKDIKNNLLNKKNPDWQDQNQIENFIKNQNELKDNIEKLVNENSTEKSEEIAEKQEQLNKLFEDLMSDEMKNLYDELQKLLSEMNKDKLLEKLEDIEMSQEDLLKEMDRSLEQFKQLEMDQKLESLKKQLEALSEKQKTLSEKTKEKKESNFNLNKEQEKIKADFNFLNSEMDDLEELNKELENKKNLPSFEKEEKEINEELQKSQENLENKKNKKASDSQKNASEKMKALASKLEALQMKMQSDSQEMDMKSLRQLLENLISFSFDQESVIDDLKNLNPKDPKYVKVGQLQQKLDEDIKLIEDSLLALSKRVPQLGPHINSEVSKIKRSLSKTIKNITERKTSVANANQQYVMTSINNLALLLDEVLKQLQKSLPGTGQCNKPGGNGKSSAADMEKMMEKMKKQLSEMKKMMGDKNGKGEKPGEKPGNKTGVKPGGSSSEGLAKLAAQQAALKKQIRDLAQSQNEDGSKAGNGLKKIIKELEKVEEDIINNKINLETLERQKDIISKMLEHDKASREQEKEKKRQSNEIKEHEFSNPNQFLEYKRKKEKELELLKSIPPSLRPYYKDKVNEYFNTLQD